MSKEYVGWDIVAEPALLCPMDAYGLHSPGADFIGAGKLNEPDVEIPTRVYCINCRTPYKFKVYYLENGKLVWLEKGAS